MSYNFRLPSGDDYILRVDYTEREANGVRVSNNIVKHFRHR
jgi:hypothetical protein